MQTDKSSKYFSIGLVVSIVFLLWNPLPAGSFPQHGGGAGTAGGDNGGGASMQTVSGKVVETLDSGGYTYALVDKEGTQTWVALPKSRIEVGSEITCMPGMVMNNFRSNSLNRTFPQIVFSSGITSPTGEAADQAISPTPEDEAPLPKTPEPKDWKDF